VGPEDVLAPGVPVDPAALAGAAPLAAETWHGTHLSAAELTDGCRVWTRFAAVDPAAVRAWAKGKGVDVSPRGRIKADVIEAYRAAGH
jgi:hypothetical protein